MMLIRRGLCATTHGDYLLPMAEICTQRGFRGEVKDNENSIKNLINDLYCKSVNQHRM